MVDPGDYNEKLHIEPDENFTKLCTKIIETNTVFQEIILYLAVRMWNHATSASQNFSHFYYHFADIVSNTADYIKDGKWIGVEDVPFKKFDSMLFFKRWLKSGKCHIKETNLK